jgi:hypothetical protein
MIALAARLDPCVNWFRLLARTKGRILWIFPAALMVGYLLALSTSAPLNHFLDRLGARRINAPLLAQARSLRLDYEKAAADPKAAVGKPVVWCVDMPASDTAYVSGRPSWPVAFNASFDDYRTNSSSGGYCRTVLAVITGFEKGLLQLRPVEQL